ncbi:MAG: DUF885 domain-containing protein [Bacteroidota bacterium]|nr:DUF885 domain-containing protein [Bacteroidota bacterium]
MFFKLNSFLVLTVISVFCFNCTNPGTTPSETITYSSSEIEAESQKANDFFERVFNESVDRHPVTQTMYGIRKDYDKWNDLSDEFEQQELEITKKNLAFLKDSINFGALDEQTKLSYQLFEYEAQEEMEKFPFRFHNYPVNQMFGFQSFVGAFLINFHQITDFKDAEAYIARLNNIPPVIDQIIENLKIREQKGIILPKYLFPKVISDSKNLITGQPMDQSTSLNSLYEDFKTKTSAVEGVTREQKDKLMEHAAIALNTSFKPSYEKLITFLDDQEKRAGEEAGVSRFPDGEKYYNLMLKYTTTTDMTSEDIHETGLKEVARIHNEMKEIMRKVNFKGTLQEFFTFMEKDPQFYYPNTDEGRQAYIDSAVVVIDNMKAQLDELFITKPKADLVVRRVEPFREKSAGKAFYYRPAPDGSRPGIYYANLYDMMAMPKYEMEALAYHEGLPGHHMQIAIAQELEGLPKFRTLGGYTAYSEGWGLYCELVPKEIGKYENPYSDFGRLAMELWRACRLVVDTGIHSKNWTREDGLNYYRNNTAAAEFEVESMVDRHIVIPSQATAYKIGMMKILDLRENAKSRLGDKFDLREFHDVVLTNGAVPLGVLEKLVENYIQKKQAS